MINTIVNNDNLNAESGSSEKKWHIWGSGIILSLIAAMTLIPIIIASGYTFYWSDDICTAKANGVYVIIAALKNAIHWWLTWQGTYTGAFLEIALSPLNGFGIAQLRVVMVLNILLFSVSLWAFVNAVCKSMGFDCMRYPILFYSLCVIGIFGFTGWMEVFFWFVGAAVYSFPMSFCLLGLAVALQSQSIKGICTSCALMFLASGGSLEIAGIGCFTMLGICVIKWMNKSLKKKDITIFGIAVLGALINTVAPGNYVRHAVIDDTGLHIGKAVIYAVLEVLQTVETLLFDTPCVLLILVAFAVGANVKKTAKYPRGGVLWTIILICLASPVVTCFPVFLGYNETVFPNRCRFIETIVIICSFMIIAAIAGYIMHEKGILVHKGEMCMVVFLFWTAISSMNPLWRVSQSVPGQMWKEIARGSYKKYYERANEIYDFIQEDINDNVFIYNAPQAVPYFPAYVLDLREDMSWWINTTYAAQFGKASVQLVSEPLTVQADGQKNIRISRNTFGGMEGYISIYKLDGEGQVTETFQELQFLDANILISIPPAETGEIIMRLYEDSAGAAQIDEKRIAY